jgi:hypothetical protein
MKKNLLIVILFLIPFYGISQTTKPIDSFLGIKFGSDAETVKTGILARGGILVKDSSDADFLYFTSVTQGTRKDIILIVKLNDNKAYEAHLAFPNELGKKSIEYYDALVKDISEIYGLGQVHKDFTPPYHAGDGQEVDAIKSGNAQYITIWSDYKNAIELTIDPSLYVLLIYQDSALYDIALKKIKDKNKADF